MKKARGEHTLEFLLAFDGRLHWYEGGYCVKFEIKRIEPSNERPHGLRYSFTLHDPKGKRLIGFDNAHAVRAKGAKFRKKQVVADHWHRTANDKGQPYAFKDAEKLIDDFFNEVERVLTERGVSFDVIKDEQKRRET